MRHHLSLKTSLAGAFGLLAVIAAGQGALSIVKLGGIRHGVNEVATNWLPSVVAVNEMRANASEVRIKQLRLLSLSDTPARLADNEAKLSATHDKLTQARKTYEPLISSAEERALYDGFASAWARFEQADAEMRRLMEAGQQQAALKLMSGSEAANLYDEARSNLQRDVALNEQGARRDAGAAIEEVGTSTVVAYVAVALALLAACVAAAFGLLRVSRPIQTMTGAMSVLAGGDASAEIPYRQRRDEIGAMAAAVQVFKDNLIRTRQLEAETAQARLAAEEQRKAGMRQMADGFEAAVGGIIGMVSSSATELQATAQTMTATATETASQSTTVAAAAEEAASNVNTVAAAAEQLGSSVQEISRQVAGSADLAQRTVREADQTGTLVQELSAAVSRIGDVVGLISTIAGQTNLLALNATIEAARAGAAGKGFAVVASEVKALAEQTAKATGEIASQIGHIQASTSQAVSSIAGITERIREINGVAASIAAAVEEQGAATQEIVRNVSQAAMGTGEVTSNIAGVAGAAEETGAAASQVLGAASELSRQSETLAAEVGRFLATVRAA
ncbi:HAMP domain-containing protein [Methylobacterium mesophilicum SR1.6/6]|uniref:HAMP domain-containing protein n=1 Tax=Methylobacterium mesophilicum SR1.6/6 TaxID=908290 RepID=A0A6B9FLS4_9HYPH|nr:methyl-accepting chemotaxis protein [Methylobacterium mesophilicum]QGY03561.1 HAMP domain-containing protein [Methylobacterium mesophilicum SR1.6/6]